MPKYDQQYCVEIIDKDTIRVFEDDTTSFYTDYYINSHYLEKTGQVDLTYIKNCSTLEFTTNYKKFSITLNKVKLLMLLHIKK